MTEPEKEDIDPSDEKWAEACVERLNTLTEKDGRFPACGTYTSVLVHIDSNYYLCDVEELQSERDGEAVSFQGVEVTNVVPASKNTKEVFVENEDE